MKEKIKKLISFLLNPKLIFCLLVSWFITNGWSYVMFGVGTYYDIECMVALSGAYLAFLWLPFTPEKVITATLAIIMLEKFFPKDEKNLAVLHDFYNKYREKWLKRKNKKRKDK